MQSQIDESKNRKIFSKIPMTQALRTLAAAKVPHEVRCYNYTEQDAPKKLCFGGQVASGNGEAAHKRPRGTIQAATELGLDHHATIKTIILEDETKKPFVCLMHGDCEISTKNLARVRGCKTVQTCTPDTADRHSGYHVGGTSPFGTRKRMTVYVQKTIYDLPEIYINAGHRGILVVMNPHDIDRVLAGLTVPVEVRK